MDLSIEMKISSNVKHRHTNSLKLGDIFYFTSLTMLGWEVKASFCSAIKDNQILCCEFSAFLALA